MVKKGWVGVDFDGTIAHFDKWLGDLKFGEPIMPMVDKVKLLLQAGIEVRIFTARISGLGETDKLEIVAAIHSWLSYKCNLPPLVVTNVKDFQMLELWDDRCVQVGENSGEFIGKSKLIP